jgi:hypothetical protein
VALYEGFAFKMRKRLAALVSLVRPHTADGSMAGAPEAVQLLGLTAEMAV